MSLVRIQSPRPIPSCDGFQESGATPRVRGITAIFPQAIQAVIVAFRRQLLDLLSHEFRSVSSLARELGMTRGDVEEDLRHALRSARAAGYDIEIVPARCKSCDFVFSQDKLAKPGRCPVCKGSRLFEPMIRIRPLPE